jgi:hypothetical protein
VLLHISGNPTYQELANYRCANRSQDNFRVAGDLGVIAWWLGQTKTSSSREEDFFPQSDMQDRRQ